MLSGYRQTIGPPLHPYSTGAAVSEGRVAAWTHPLSFILRVWRPLARMRKAGVGTPGQDGGQKALPLDSVPCLKFSLCSHSVKCHFDSLLSCMLIFPYDSGTLVPPPLEELVICRVCFYPTYFYSVEFSKWFWEPVRTVPYVYCFHSRHSRWPNHLGQETQIPAMRIFGSPAIFSVYGWDVGQTPEGSDFC